MKINILQKYIIPIFLVACLIALAFQSPKASASGDATFSMTPSSSTITAGSPITLSISETSSSSDNTNAVQADVSYNPTYFNYTDIFKTGPFTNCVPDTSSTSGSNNVEIVACFSSNSVSGSQPFINITFTAKSVSSAVSSPIAMVSGSNIDNPSGTSVLNTSIALPSTNVTINPYVAPPTPPPATQPTGSTGPSSGSTGSSSTLNNHSSSSYTGSSPNSSASSSSPTKPITTTPTSPATTPPSSSSIYGSVSITVTASNGTPINNAKVTIGNKTEYTDRSGLVNFSGLTNGQHKVIIAAPGKKTYVTTTNLSGGQNKFLSYKLASSNSSVIIMSILILMVLLILGILAYITWINRRNHPPTMPISNLPPVEPPTTGPNIIHPAPTPLTTTLTEP